MAKYLFISDLHLAPSKGVDNFKKDALFVNTFLAWKNKQKIKRTYVIGDIFELWQGGWTLSKKKRLEKIESRYPALIKALKNFKLIYGNHDFYARKKYNMSEMIKIDKNIITIHGHQFDKFFKSDFMTGVSRVACTVYGWVESLVGAEKMTRVLPKLEEWYKEKLIQQKKSAKDLPDDLYIEKAINFAYDKNKKVIILGHTHKRKHISKILKKKKIIYINVGGWVDKEATAVLVNTNTKLISIYGFITKKPKLLKNIKY